VTLISESTRRKINALAEIIYPFDIHEEFPISPTRQLNSKKINKRIPKTDLRLRKL
jgi:hypothetical protein